MDIDQLKSNWQQQIAKKESAEQLINREKEMKAIENNMLAIDKNVNSRTRYGVITFVIILASMIMFDYFLYLLGNSLTLTLGIASWIVIIAVAMTQLILVKRNYNTDENTLTIKESLQSKLSKVEAETQFYLSIVWKILAPMSIGFVLILVETNASLPAAAGQMTLFILGCYWSHHHNKQYVAKNLTPIKEEIESNLKALFKKD